MNCKVRNLISTLAASVVLCLAAEAQVADYGNEYGIFSFEDGTDPATHGKGSELSVSQEHAKLGTHSLKWKWRRPGSSVSFLGDIPYLPENPDPKETSVSSFVFWIYSPEALEGDIRFSFLKDGKECCHLVSPDGGVHGWRLTAT